MDMNRILQGDAAQILKTLPEGSVDLVVTDPPYLVNYQDRSGRRLANDDNAAGVLPVFEPMARVMKPDSFAISFAGWGALPEFATAWQAAGLRIVSQIVWAKDYASRRGFTQYCHETAYVLAKGNPKRPTNPIPSVMPWAYSGNKAHPTEKAVEVLTPLIRSFSNPGDLVLDPFAGSGSTAVAAALNGRDYLAIELEAKHCATARARLAGVEKYRSAKAAA